MHKLKNKPIQMGPQISQSKETLSTDYRKESTLWFVLEPLD